MTAKLGQLLVLHFKLKVKMNKVFIYGFQWVAIPTHTVLPYCMIGGMYVFIV